MSDPATVQLKFAYGLSEIEEGMRTASARMNRDGSSVRRLWHGLLAVSAILVLVMSAAIPAVLGLGRDVVLVSFCAYLAATVLMWAYGAAYVRALARDLLHSPVYQGDVEMEMSRDGISVQGKHYRSWLDWAAIEEIIDLKNGLGLCSGYGVYVIPDGALCPSASRDVVRERISAWRKAAA